MPRTYRRLFIAGTDGGKAQAGKPINGDVLIQYKRNGAVGDCFHSASPRPKTLFRIRRPAKMPRTYRRPFAAGTDVREAQAGKPINGDVLIQYKRNGAARDCFHSTAPYSKTIFGYDSLSKKLPRRKTPQNSYGRSRGKTVKNLSPSEIWLRKWRFL